jgi:hypothetical protein
MKKIKNALAALGMATVALVALPSCDNRSDTEKAVDDAGDKIEDAAEEIGDAVEDATD